MGFTVPPSKRGIRKGILFGTQGKRCSRGDEMNVEMPLLEYLAYRAGCRWLSDLHCLDGCQRIRLHHVLEQLPPEAAPLREWNDAVAYLTGRQPAATAATAAAARRALLDALRRDAGGAGPD